MIALTRSGRRAPTPVNAILTRWSPERPTLGWKHQAPTPTGLRGPLAFLQAGRASPLALEKPTGSASPSPPTARVGPSAAERSSLNPRHIFRPTRFDAYETATKRNPDGVDSFILIIPRVAYRGNPGLCVGIPSGFRSDRIRGRRGQHGHSLSLRDRHGRCVHI